MERGGAPAPPQFSSHNPSWLMTDPTHEVSTLPCLCSGPSCMGTPKCMRSSQTCAMHWPCSGQHRQHIAPSTAAGTSHEQLSLALCLSFASAPFRSLLTVRGFSAVSWTWLMCTLNVDAQLPPATAAGPSSRVRAPRAACPPVRPVSHSPRSCPHQRCAARGRPEPALGWLQLHSHGSQSCGYGGSARGG